MKENTNQNPPPRCGMVYVNCRLAGVIEETSSGFRFTYNIDYISDGATFPVSLTLPKRSEPYCSTTLFPAFCGLLAEGGLAEMHCQVHGLDMDDYFGRLLATCYETIGAISIAPYSRDKK